MIKATRNQLGNIKNPYQTETKRVLTVCSAGALRSPTAANVLHRQFGYNTRSCGSCKDFAIIPITETLIYWADEIVFVNEDNWYDLDEDEQEAIHNAGVKVIKLEIEDDYSWGDKDLESIIIEQYMRVSR